MGLPVLTVASILGALGAIGAFSEPYIESARRHAWRGTPWKILSPQEYAQAASRGIGKRHGLVDLAKQSGVDDAQFELLVELSKQLLNPEQVIALRLRGDIDHETEAALLSRMGYGDMERIALGRLSFLIPPVNDLIHFAVKGAFSEEEIKQFRLSAEYPAEVAEWARKQGLSEEWSLKYWQAHWQNPSPQQVLEMLHRGEIDDATVDIFLKAADYPPFWRDALKKISYSPLTRVDTRRLRKDKVISFEDVKQEYRNQGYDDKRATWLAEWTENDVHREKKQALKDLTDGLRGTIVTGIINGSIDEEYGRSYLSDLGYSAEEISSLIEIAWALRVERVRSRMIELVGDLYVKRLADDAETRKELSKRGASQAEIDLRMEEWGIERELRAPSEREEKERDLTKSEIIESYKEGISTKAETEKDLLAMRYDAREVERLIALADYDRRKAETKQRIEIVHNDLLRGKIDEVTASTRLDAIGLPSIQRDSLLSTWMRAVESAQFDIPLATLQAWYEREIRTYDETLKAVLARGAKQADALDLMKLWNAKATEKAEREARAAANRAKSETKVVRK